MTVTEMITQIHRYMNIPEGFTAYSGMALGEVFISTTSFRDMLESKHYASFDVQYVDLESNEIEYAHKDLAGTPLFELQTDVIEGTFEKENPETYGDVMYEIVDGGVLVKPTGDVVITCIKVS